MKLRSIPKGKRRLKISFSGGRTSAVMTKMLLEKHRETHDIKVIFVNTGCEHEKTLEFIKNCDDVFGFGAIWIDPIIDPEIGKGVRGKIVSFETASRNGEPFEAYIAKHGIPNRTAPKCTGVLKEECMNNFMRNIGWKSGTYETAIGIRFDEIDRMSAKAKDRKFIYPLAQWGWTKQMVIDECKSWPFDLMLPGEHYGNCVWCWKKSFRKLMTLAKESPDVFHFPREMEKKYGHMRANKSGRRTFFRGDKSVDDIFEMASHPFEKFSDANGYDESLDLAGGCSESCEIGTDEADIEAAL